MNSIEVQTRSGKHTFLASGIDISDSDACRFPWRRKNGKTLQETLQGHKYSHLRYLLGEFPEQAHMPLGHFLELLKNQGFSEYKLFLNKYGDEDFVKIKLVDQNIKKLKGLYLFATDSQVRYVGRCLDSFQKRISNGYGTIAPKKCYLDGNSTNCRINSFVAKNRNHINFYVCPLSSSELIKKAEHDVINYFQPDLNLTS